MVLNLADHIHLEKDRIHSCVLSQDDTFEIEPDYWRNFNDILIIGHGTVGKAMETILNEAGYMPDIFDPFKYYVRKLKTRYDIIHICFPCFKEEVFIEQCLKYIHNYGPKYFIIHSTVGIFTIEKLLEGLVMPHPVKIYHIPIRGVELYGAEGIKKFVSFIGPAEKYCIHDVGLNWYMDTLKMKYEWVESTRESAFGKLICTTWYGMLIAFANQVAKITDKHYINFHGAYVRPMETDKIGKRYHRYTGGKVIAQEYLDRPVNLPGTIGGHCVIPNLDLLPEEAEQLIKWIKEMENYMIKEGDENVRKKRKKREAGVHL